MGEPRCRGDNKVVFSSLHHTHRHYLVLQIGAEYTAGMAWRTQCKAYARENLSCRFTPRRPVFSVERCVLRLYTEPNGHTARRSCKIFNFGSMQLWFNAMIFTLSNAARKKLRISACASFKTFSRCRTLTFNQLEALKLWYLENCWSQYCWHRRCLRILSMICVLWRLY